MIGLSTKEPARWQPPWASGPDDPVYFYRIASLTDRDLFEAEAVRYGAARVFPWDLSAKFAEGLAALLPDNPDDVARLTELQGRVGNGETLGALEQSELDKVSLALGQYWPPFGQLVDQAARRDALMPMLAVRRFLISIDGMVDAEGNALVLKRGLDGLVIEEQLSGIEPVVLRLLGLEIYASLYARGAEKNSEPPLKSGGDQKTSPSPRKRRAAGGRSAKTSGPKTRH